MHFGSSSNSNKDLSLNLERLSRNHKVSSSNPTRDEKEWSICSTKSSESSEPTDEEIADLVQRKPVVNLRTKLSTKAVSDSNFNAVKLKR